MTGVDLDALIDACRTALLASRHEHVQVAAAASTCSGGIYTGLQVRSVTCGHCSTCAEPVAIGAALGAGADDFDACVALRLGGTAEILSPCGACREVLRDHGFRRVIVAATDSGLITATPDELLPWS
ncbi:MAG: hypothetical protein AUG49_20285 [Catenulispora sp. 13_1_20CM_3_70_7]|nr:MAG: hypothetical protein AUG49_20285 [Catenulispora sp. 13_1_20CM_3_70_7]